MSYSLLLSNSQKSHTLPPRHSIQVERLAFMQVDNVFSSVQVYDCLKDKSTAFPLR